MSDSEDGEIDRDYRAQCQACGIEVDIDSRDQIDDIRNDAPCGHDDRIWLVWGHATNPAMTDGGRPDGGTYRDPCPKCGDRLVGFSKEDYVAHLQENGETLAAKIEEEMVVSREEIASAQTDGSDGFAPTQTDACGYQMHDCPECDERTDHKVWVVVGENGDVSYRKCTECGNERVARYLGGGEWGESTDVE